MNSSSAALLAVATLAFGPTPQQAAAPAPTSFKLVKVDVVGVQRYMPAEVIKVGGLTIGQIVATGDLDGAARQLASIGLFKSVKYRYVTTATDMTLTFDMAEEELTTPVVFDNFIWFTDDELTKLVRERIPQFDRLVPGNAGISGFLSRELQRLLEARTLPGRVEFSLSSDRRFIFSVTGAGPALQVCAVRFAGAQQVTDAALQDAARELKGVDYSRMFTVAFSNGTLRQLYRRRGFWKVSFGDPVVVPDSGGGCGGLSVTLTVAEGPAYQWDHAEWTGNLAVPAKDLDAALGMRTGELADITKIEAGLRAAQAAYLKLGYLQLTIKPTPRLDDAARRAVLEMAVTDGPQFFMGTLEIVGLSPSDESSLRKKWSLKQGAIYDGGYLSRFVTDFAAPLARSGPKQAVAAGIKPDPATHQVTVRIEFK